MTDFHSWRSFNYKESTVQLWIFKKSTTSAKFRAWHVRTDRVIEELFRSAIEKETSRITEYFEYTPLAQNNEASCLSHRLEHSKSFLALLELINQPELEHTTSKESDLKGACGYAVKFQCRETVYAVRKTAPTWRPTTRKSLINTIFKNGELSAMPDESFSFDSTFDFYGFNQTIFVASKRAYESSMSDKQVYQTSFEELILSNDFLNLFTDVGPLKSYIGNNSMQLRRMTAIQQKSIYTRDDFLSKLRETNKCRSWGLNFDESGKIIACELTAKTILQVLLDHRLLSEITETTYDVPDATQVSG
jgi:Domain of unknown function (DUF4868)